LLRGGKHFIRITAKVRQETKTRTGDRVRLRFTVPDRAVVTKDFKALPPGKQNFIVRRIDSTT